MQKKEDHGRKGQDWKRLLHTPQSSDHLVQLYQDDDFLAEAVTTFILEGLRRDEAVVLVVTPAHRDLFLRKLRMAGTDVIGSMMERRLKILDAATTLSSFMPGGKLDQEAFRRTVGAVIREAREARPRVRAFGEMVDILWRRGDLEGAERLEGFWNDLAREQEFSLLCAYYIDNLSREAYAGPLQCICRSHTHLIPARDYGAFEGAVSSASEEVLGKPLSDVMRNLADRAPLTTDMPLGQATLLWLNEHMPATCDRIIRGARERASS
jgi:hypothetical protein